MKSRSIVPLLALSLAPLALPAHAEGPPVSIQFSIGTPPPPPPAYVVPAPAYVAPAYPPPAVVLPAPPMMLWYPDFGGYIAMGTAQPLFFLGGAYYFSSGGRWYSGPGYNGPWRPARIVPPGLRRFHDRDWRQVQEHARRYERNPRWGRFRPESVPHADRPADRGRGPDHRDWHGDRRPGRGGDQGPDRGGH